MSEQAAPLAREYRGVVTLTLPLWMIQRLEPMVVQRARSRFIEQAIEAALDKAEQDRERERV